MLEEITIRGYLWTQLLMCQEGDGDDSQIYEDTEYNVIAHVRLYETFFNLFHRDVHKRAICYIFDIYRSICRVAEVRFALHVKCVND